MNLNLDFSAIDNLRAPAKKEYNQRITPKIQEYNEGLIARHNKEKEIYKVNVDIYKEYQKNIAISNEIQAEILDGLKSGELEGVLLLKACKIISLMTSNNSFYEQVENDYKNIYGEGMLNPTAISLELEQIQERISKMRESLKRKGLNHDIKKRILQAIETHENKGAYLVELLNKTI